MHLYSTPQHNGPAIIMQESSSEKGWGGFGGLTSGPRPLTRNLGRLNPEKGGGYRALLERGRVVQRK